MTSSRRADESRCAPDGRRKRGLQTLPSLERTGGGHFLCPLQQQGRELVGHVDHHIMPTCKLLLPPAALSYLVVNLANNTNNPPPPNVSTSCITVPHPPT